MKIKFTVNHQAEWGQEVFLFIREPNNELFEISMKCVAEAKWEALYNVQNSEVVEYKYFVKCENQVCIEEFGAYRVLDLPKAEDQIHVVDTWRKRNGDSPFETIAFSDVFFKRSEIKQKSFDADANLIIRLRNPQVEPNRHIAIIGNQQALGDWDVSKKIRLNESEFPFWTVALNSKEIQFPIEYKYLLIDSKTDEVIEWSGGENRIIEQVANDELTIQTDEHYRRTVTSWKTAGLAIPVFSLRSEESFGTGDFMDLKKMVDWAYLTGQHFIQILPINDTILYHSNYDSYPYNAVSVYALHPIYLRLEAMGELEDKKEMIYFDRMKKKLNKNSFSDYQNVLNEKWKFFKLIFEQDGKSLLESSKFKKFFTDNQEWLLPYAVFSYLRDKNGTPEFGKWSEHSVYEKEKIDELASEDSPCYSEISFYYFLQYHLHEQLIEVRDYAHKYKVALKSDVPIGVSPRSVDAWVEPQLFNTHMQAGAPPDDFSVTGQNWGFPTYNWDEMAKDDYQWWKKRFRKFVEYFDAYRIDHILGFFRIWEIPGNDVWAMTGTFSPALGFSVSDLSQRALHWDEERFLKPYLKEHVVRAIFNEYADDVMREYLNISGWQSFEFKKEFDTQKKIEAHFASLGYNFTKKELKIRDGLYALHSEVLFVRDKNDETLFHPRISMQSSIGFRDLDEDTRRALDAIYNEYFYKRHNTFWKNEAMKKLPAIISATNMLVCGEDLGMVPESVPEVMHELELLTLEIQRMPKKMNIEFAMPSDAPYLSVCTTSTHDMNPIRAWWEEDEQLTQRFFNRALGKHGPAPKECTVDIAEQIIDQHLQSDAMLVILPWQDWLSMDKKLRNENPHAERINVPADPRNFWCYRMHLTLEQLLEAKSFNAMIKKKIKESGR